MERSFPVELLYFINEKASYDLIPYLKFNHSDKKVAHQIISFKSTKIDDNLINVIFEKCQNIFQSYSPEEMKGISDMSLKLPFRAGRVGDSTFFNLTMAYIDPIGNKLNLVKFICQYRPTYEPKYRKHQLIIRLPKSEVYTPS